MIVFLSLILLSFVCFVLHVLLSKKPLSKFRCVELLLLYELVFYVGILGIFSFLGLTLFAEQAAAHLIWPMSPFQQGLANVNLAFGILGFLTIWWRHHFWTAIVIGCAFWLIGDGIHHIYDYVVNGNASEGNMGILMYSDICIPTLMLILLFFYLWFGKKIKRWENS
jgi:hypothetical protein